MSNLVVVGFPKAQEAEDVRLELVKIQQEHLIALEDAVVLGMVKTAMCTCVRRST